MERLWSPAGATSGNQRQMGRTRKPRKQAKSVAVGCHRLPRPQNGKEEVDGSSPSEGSAKSLLVRAFAYVFSRLLVLIGPRWSRLWSFRAEKCALVGRVPS